MKKILIAFSAAILMSVTSCSVDFVTPEHNSAEPVDEYLTRSPERMFESLVAAYDPLNWFDYFYQYTAIHFVSDLMSDDIYCGGSSDGDQPMLVRVHYYNVVPTEEPDRVWITAYSGINRACTLLENVDNTTGLDDATKALWRAEATILRSYYYNILWKFWGNIPFYRENLHTPYTTPQLGHDEVYANVIQDIEDVVDAGILPMKAASGNEGRVTQAMAMMLYAEMVQYQNDESRYAKALGYMKEIIGGGYSLVADYAGIWEETGEWNSESIWEINYISEGAGRDWGAPIATGGNVYATLIGIPGISGSNDWYNGWGFSPVTQKAYDMYGPGDIRRDGGILRWEDYVAQNPGASYEKRWQDTGLFLRKYIGRANGIHGQLASADMNHNSNFRIYRFAETLLNAAEFANRLGQDGSSYLKQVRDRAHSTATGTSLDDIIEERHLELMGEGKRYWDLVRTGKAASVLTADSRAYDGSRPNSWSESKKYWPLPQAEIDKDPALDQNNY